MGKMKVGGLVVTVVRKNIKNLHVAVYPPNGWVRVATPMQVNDQAVRTAVASRLGWIRRQQKKLVGQERQSQREYVSRESHYFFGRRYLLNVIYHDGGGRISMDGRNCIDLYVPFGAGRRKRERVLQEWYRKELKVLIPSVVARWEKTMGLKVTEWGVKKMKTRWGTCNPSARRIWINLELAKKPVQCLDYIVLHEMVHLLERHHNERFIDHMDEFLPRWRSLRDLLNSFPLRHEKWVY
jgi:predicted metal-dependent hydrolase